MIFEDVGFDDPLRKEEIKEDLRSKILEVTFNKKDGEERATQTICASQWTHPAPHGQS